MTSSLSYGLSGRVAVWDDINREWIKKQPTFKEEFWTVIKEARTIHEDYF